MNTKHEFQPIHIFEVFWFLVFFFQLPEESPYLRTDFSFIRCILGSKNSSPGHQSFTSLGASRRINLQPPTCPLPGSWWNDKAGIQTPITSSTASSHAPLSCPPLAPNPFSSVRARVCSWKGSIADRKQGTDPFLKEIEAEGKKDLIQQQLIWLGSEGLKKITLECCCLPGAYTAPWISPKPRYFQSE